MSNDIMVMHVPVEMVKTAMKWQTDNEIREARTAGFYEGRDAAYAQMYKSPYNAILNVIVSVKGKCNDISSDETQPVGDRINAAAMYGVLDTLHDILHGSIDEDEFNRVLATTKESE